MQSIAFIYRSTGNESREQMLRKKRPAYFSKLACLKSFLNAANRLSGSGCKKAFYFPNDSPIPEDRLSLMEKYGKIIDIGGRGNVESCRFIYELAKKQDTEFVYFSEDDYIYCENAFESMLDGLNSVKSADYITLYDHPDRYANIRTEGMKKAKVYTGSYNHWRTVSSATMTWGGRAKAFRKDWWKFRLFSLGVEKKDGPALKLLNAALSLGYLYPNWEQNAWHFIQGIKPFYLAFPKRKLIGSIPSLATHCHSEFMAPLVNWEKISKDAEKLKL
ncbi:hypothetical protein HYU17_02440 [Candidatus Woesearchaeota archaeon]|nr:hypothetical protein [Candidatus Woesearchaeota archaeon]